VTSVVKNQVEEGAALKGDLVEFIHNLAEEYKTPADFEHYCALLDEGTDLVNRALYLDGFERLVPALQQYLEGYELGGNEDEDTAFICARSRKDTARAFEEVLAAPAIIGLLMDLQYANVAPIWLGMQFVLNIGDTLRRWRAADPFMQVVAPALESFQVRREKGENVPFADVLAAIDGTLHILQEAV
jgi:hypothetical protein